MKHPATFSPEILASIAMLLDPRPLLILDPFAGIGKVNLLEHFDAHVTVANELEFEWAVMAGELQPTTVGDATCLPYRAGMFDAVVTSPCYGNRMADCHEAKDTSRRITYRHYLGHPLSPGSAAGLQWGSKYRALHADAWAEVWRVLKPGGQFVLNVKDHIRAKERQAVVKWHAEAACWIGFKVEKIRLVEAKGMKMGQNYDARVPVEHILAFRKVAA